MKVRWCSWRPLAIAAGLDQHANAQLLKPLPRIGTISLGQVVAEDGPLARAWLRIICACRHTNTAYDPAADAPATNTSSHRP